MKTNPLKMGLPVYALIIVFMKTTQHAAFRRFLEQEPLVEQAHRSSGEGCFWLTARCPDQDQLSGLLDRILPYGNYRVTLSIGVVK